MLSMIRNTILALAASLLVAALPWTAALAQSAPTGTYKVAGKSAALTQVVAYKGQPESGKPVTVLVFTAKDQKKSSNAASDALFGEMGDAVVVKVFDDGKVYNAELVHAAFDLPNNTLTAFSGVTIKNFKKADGQLSGELTSGGEQDARGQKWEVNLAFTTKAP